MSALAPRPAALVLPEAGRFWIRYVPRVWDAPDGPWLDLAGGCLGRPVRAAAPPPAPVVEAAGRDGGAGRNVSFDDVVYLPPVPPRLAVERDAVGRELLAAGTPVVVQLRAGDESSLLGSDGAFLVVDLLAALLAGGLAGDPESALAPGEMAAAVWPLLPGLTDDAALWERGCRRLAAAGIRCVQAMAPALTPAERRRLAETAGGGGRVFDAMFHRPPPAERDFARLAHRHGLAPFLFRPLPRPPLPGAANRRIGGCLGLAAELSQRLGRPAGETQALFRAARWIDSTSYDVPALAREGNLGVVAALAPVARQAVAECAAGNEPALLVDLLNEYLSG